MARGEAPAMEHSDGAILLGGGCAVSRGAVKEGGRPGSSWARPVGGWS